MTFRLIIADDHALVREGLRTMLADAPDLEVIAEARDGYQALDLCRRLRPDLVLMDVRMPGMNGLAATRAVKAECPKTAVLIVTTHESADYLLEAIKGGAAGYVLKEATKAELLQAVRAVLAGDSPLNPNLAMQLLRRLAREAGETARHEEAAGHPDSAARHTTTPAAEAPLESPLTPRELDVVRALCEGATNRQIAQKLHLSLSTVKGHLERITDKLEVSDRTQAAVRAIELGLVRPGRKRAV
jgi:DNA-binding NarL/FixJ family response regulator